MFLQPINIKNAPTSKSAEAKMIAGVIREDPIIPAIDNPVNIKAPKRKIGIPIMKQMTVIVPTSKSILLGNIVTDSGSNNIFRVYHMETYLLLFSVNPFNRVNQ